MGRKGGKDKEVDSRKFQDSDIIPYHTIIVDTIIYVSEHTECTTPNIMGSMCIRKKKEVRALLYHVTQAGVASTVCFKEILTLLGMGILRIVTWRETDLLMEKRGTSYIMYRKLSAQHRLNCHIHLHHCLGVCILRSHRPRHYLDE